MYNDLASLRTNFNMSGEVFRPFQRRTKFQNITPDDALFDPSVIVAALLGGAGRDVTFSWSNYAKLLISNRLQYVLGKQKNLSSFRAFCVNETTESTNIPEKLVTGYSRGLAGDHAFAVRGTGTGKEV